MSMFSSNRDEISTTIHQVALNLEETYGAAIKEMVPEMYPVSPQIDTP
jgi:hypothetical protein